MSGHPVERCGIGRDEQVPGAVETEIELGGELFEDVDGPVHEIHHRLVRPPVAITLCGLVRGQGQRWPWIHDDDTPNPVANGQLVCGRHAGDSGADYYDVGVLRHRTRKLFTL